MAGMKDCKVFAISKEEQTTIFQFSDIGLVSYVSRALRKLPKNDAQTYLSSVPLRRGP